MEQMAQRAPQHTTPSESAAGRRTNWLASLARATLREPDLRQNGALSLLDLALRVSAAGLLIWIGYIHFLLWHEGYKYLPTSGPFFLVDAIAAVVLEIVLLAWPRVVVGIVSAGFVAGTIAALLISLWVGLFGFHESMSASFVVQSLWIESVTVVLLVAWSLIALATMPRDRE
jgi:hypothetical protein